MVTTKLFKKYKTFSQHFKIKNNLKTKITIKMMKFNSKLNIQYYKNRIVMNFMQKIIRNYKFQTNINYSNHNNILQITKNIIFNQANLL